MAALAANVPMPQAVYQEIEEYCKQKILKLQPLTKDDLVALNVTHLPFNTVLSIMSQTYQEYCKSVSSMSKDPAVVEQVTRDFKAGKTVWEVALSIKYPPYLVCKMIVDGLYALHQDKERIKEYSKEPWRTSSRSSFIHNSRSVRQCEKREVRTFCKGGYEGGTREVVG